MLQTPGAVIMINFRHLLCHLLCGVAIQKLAGARIEQVVLEPRCVQPGDDS